MTMLKKIKSLLPKKPLSKMPSWFNGKLPYKFIIEKDGIDILEGDNLAKAYYYFLMALKNNPNCNLSLNYIVKHEASDAKKD